MQTISTKALPIVGSIFNGYVSEIARDDDGQYLFKVQSVDLSEIHEWYDYETLATIFNRFALENVDSEIEAYLRHRKETLLLAAED